MRTQETLKLSMRMFKTRKMRTLLTILGISVGFGAILFLVSLGYGLQNLLLERIATSEALLSLDVVPSQGELVSLTPESLVEISELPNVEAVSPMVSIPGQITIDDLTGDISVNVVHESFFRYSGLRTEIGEFFGPEDTNKIIISEPIAILFDIKNPEDAIGKEATFAFFVPAQPKDLEDGLAEEEFFEEDLGVEEIEIITLEEKFEIVGVLKEDYLAYVYIPSSALNHLYFPKFSQAKVKVFEDEFMPGVRAKVLEKGFSVSSLSDTIEQTNKIFKIIQIVLSIFGIVALIVSAIGMFNTMTISLLERTQEIGIMKALGAGNFDVWKLFISEAIIMGFLGGIGGLLIGFITSRLFNFGINILARTLGGESVNLFQYPIWFILTIVIFSAVIGFSTGLYPARRAAKLSPLEALRYK